MALISLRAYNREIEGMIDNGQLDEAVAHCRYIFATFPKHIASYRLLGKAHLEQQRISDATDIFQRVLTAIPDDFISNVGMSIIREDENNLDAAIWHMELAYEAQPANVAIQDELRRLYGRRDGTQPPKVRLTRGALARMYAKGGLYDQAIAELRAAISEDPNRPDLQQLLAQMFFQTSQRVEAVEICVNILKKIPLCLEANRILAVSLPKTEGSDAVKNYRQTVIAMDPYYAFAEPDAISSDQVPESAVNIERLEWKSGLQIGETPDQPSWATSLGISMEKPSDESIPDWLKSAEAPAPGTKDEKAAPSISPFIWDTQEVEKIITDTSKPEGDIPDWMKDAGWKPATGETPPPSEEGKPEEPFAELPASDELEKANLPEWLRGIVPEGVVGPNKQDVLPKEDEPSNPWLEPHQPGPTDSIIQWLEEKKPDAPATPPTLGKNAALSLEDEVPDWLKDLDVPQTKSGQERIPAPTPAFASEPPDSTGETVHPESTDAGTGATLSEGEAEPPLAAQPGSMESVFPPEISAVKVPEAVNVDEIPDWLKEIAEEIPATQAPLGPEPELSTEQPHGAQGAPTVETPADVEETPTAEGSSKPEEVPETQLPELAESMPIAEVPIRSEEQPAVAEALPETELPAARIEPPVGEVISISEQLPAQELPMTAQPLPEAEIPAISEQIQAVEKSLISEEPPTTLPQAFTEKLPVMEEPSMETEQPQAEQPLPIEGESAPIETSPSGESTEFAWLEGLIGEQSAKGDELIPPTPEGEITPPEWVKLESEPSSENDFQQEQPAVEEPAALPAKDIPEWIKGLGEEPPIETSLEAPVSTVPSASEISQPEELPTWLQETEQPEDEIKPPISPTGALEWKEDKLPDWLKEIKETAPSEEAGTPSQIPSKEELPRSAEIVSPEEPLAEVPFLTTEARSMEVPAMSEEIPAEEVSSLVEEQAQIGQPIAAESGQVAEPPAVQAVEIPDWIKGLGEASAIKKVVEEPLSATDAETEPPQVTELPLGLNEPEQAEEEIKPPFSPTGVLEWKEDKLPTWLKEIKETAPSDESGTPSQIPSKEELPLSAEIVSIEEPLAEVPVLTTEARSVEVPAMSEEIPAEEVSSLAEEQAQIGQPIAAESGLVAEPPAVQAVEIPDWIKGLGEASAIKEVVEEPLSATTAETETPQVTELPLGLNEPEQAEEEIKPPFSPTGALEWKEDKLPTWLREITESAPSDESGTPSQIPSKEELPLSAEIVSPEEPLAEVPVLTTEERSVEVPAISEEIPAGEVSSLAEGQAQVGQPLPAESGLVAEAPAIQAEEFPEWIKGLGEASAIEKVAQEPVSAAAAETETPQLTELPLGLHELEQPVEDIKLPISPTGALAWKDEELPAWLKEITEPIPDKETAATIEALPIENIPTLSVEASPVPSEEIAPPILAGEKAVAEAQLETGPWIPGVKEKVQPVPAIHLEAVAESASVMEGLSTKAGESTPVAAQEQTPVPVEVISEGDKVALADARNAINQGQTSLAVGFYSGLIKHNYFLDEIIKDLKEALYRFPVEVDMWVTLGDAHYHSNELQEALNAYTKAEELVR